VRARTRAGTQLSIRARGNVGPGRETVSNAAREVGREWETSVGGRSHARAGRARTEVLRAGGARVERMGTLWSRVDARGGDERDGGRGQRVRRRESGGGVDTKSVARRGVSKARRGRGRGGGGGRREGGEAVFVRARDARRTFARGGGTVRRGVDGGWRRVLRGVRVQSTGARAQRDRVSDRASFAEEVSPGFDARDAKNFGGGGVAVNSLR